MSARNTGTRRSAFFPKEIDLATGGPYANYNWEFFFHTPLAIAVHLSKNQRFAEAQRWFHLIFDPTANDPAPAGENPHWRFLAFRRADGGRQIDEMLALLSKPEAECDDEELQLKASLLEAFDASIDSGRMPGAAETMGAGAVAGHLATSGATTAGLHGVSEFRSSDSADEAKHLGRALAKKIGQFFVQQGWVAASAVR